MNTRSSNILITTSCAAFFLLASRESHAVDDIKGDPAAHKLMIEAHKSRATWKGFTGFTAQLTVNQNGKEASGTVEVDAKGSVQVSLPDAAAKAWVGEVFTSLVEHRLERSESRHDAVPASSGGGADGKHPRGCPVRC